jgi:hypothetical protein
MSEFEERVKRSLSKAGAGHEGDPNEAQPEFLRRYRERRKKTQMVTSLGALGLVAVVVALLFTNPWKDEPQPVAVGGRGTPNGHPSASPAPSLASSPTPSARSDAPVQLVYGSGGDIWAQRADGTVENLTNSPETELNPAISPDGTTVYFERLDDQGDPSLALMTLKAVGTSPRRARPGYECCLRDGATPVFAPLNVAADLGFSQNGLTARSIPAGAPGNHSEQAEVAFGDPASEAESRFLAGPGEQGPTDVFQLAWDLGRPYLYYSTAPIDRSGSGAELYRATIKQGPHQTFEADGPPVDIRPANASAGADYLAPTSSGTGSAEVIQVEGEAGHAEIGSLNFDGAPASGAGPHYETITSLDSLSLSLDPQNLRMVYAGCAAVSPAPGGGQVFSVGGVPAWLVGDGHSLWMVNMSGDTARVAANADIDGGFSVVETACN